MVNERKNLRKLMDFRKTLFLIQDDADSQQRLVEKAYANMVKDFIQIVSKKCRF